MRERGHLARRFARILPERGCLARCLVSNLPALPGAFAIEPLLPGLVNAPQVREGDAPATAGETPALPARASGLISMHPSDMLIHQIIEGVRLELICKRSFR
jgi:hypothetical protein